MELGGIGCGVIFLAIVNASLVLSRVCLPWLPATLAVYRVVGLSVMVVFLPPLAILQTAVADEFRGQVFGAIGAPTTLMVVAGLGIGILLTQFAGSALVLDPSGVLSALAGVAALGHVPTQAPLERERKGAELAR